MCYRCTLPSFIWPASWGTSMWIWAKLATSRRFRASLGHASNCCSSSSGPANPRAESNGPGSGRTDSHCVSLPSEQHESTTNHPRAPHMARLKDALQWILSLGHRTNQCRFGPGNEALVGFAGERDAGGDTV